MFFSWRDLALLAHLAHLAMVSTSTASFGKVARFVFPARNSYLARTCQAYTTKLQRSLKDVTTATGRQQWSRRELADHFLMLDIWAIFVAISPRDLAACLLGISVRPEAPWNHMYQSTRDHSGSRAHKTGGLVARLNEWPKRGLRLWVCAAQEKVAVKLRGNIDYISNDDRIITKPVHLELVACSQRRGHLNLLVVLKSLKIEVLEVLDDEANRELGEAADCVGRGCCCSSVGAKASRALDGPDLGVVVDDVSETLLAISSRCVMATSDQESAESFLRYFFKPTSSKPHFHIYAVFLSSVCMVIFRQLKFESGLVGGVRCAA
ncbi:hypothetical protein B0H16DRAFT_1470918 [Mycena metata]|uniref:Uncharacterized protein n=1 Tax=Mycena metata TaxID=1033252 RepID=A0AAD7HSQ7_9AGAR|nr:hypothetical protein B0H16DRAFT_1470918 [Mycena metata]